MDSCPQDGSESFSLRARHEAQGKPAEGWVFPSTAKCGHLEQGTAKNQHSAAIEKANAKTVEKNRELKKAGQKLLPLPLKAFEPYVMRHTALTRMAPLCAPFTLRGSPVTVQSQSLGGTAIPRQMPWKQHSRNSAVAQKWSPTVVTTQNSFPQTVKRSNR